MPIYRSNLGFRMVATVIAASFVAIGVFALFGGDDTVTALQRERANGFGVTAIIGGISALWLTWFVEDLSNIWCRPPKRWR